MKQIIIVIGIILLVANLLFGLILSSYEVLYVLFSMLGGIEFVLSLFSYKTFENNWFLLVIVLSLTVQSIILLITNKVSIKIK